MKTYLPLLFLMFTTHSFAQQQFSCMVQPLQIVEVRAPITGILKEIYVKNGEYVKKGQLIASLDNSIEQSAVSSASYRTQLKSGLQVSHHKVKYTQEKLEKLKQLRAENFISEQAYSDALHEMNQAKAEQKAAQESIQQAQYEYGQAKAELKRKNIYSPFSGIIMQQYVPRGSLVGPSEGKYPIFKIAETEKFKVSAIVPLKYYNTFKKNQLVDVIPESPFQNERTQLKISQIDPVIDASSGTFSISGTLISKNIKFPSGIKCNLSIQEPN